MEDNMILSWDSVIEDDGQHTEFLNQEGKFVFRVTKFERNSYRGSAKIPAGVPVARLTLEVNTPNGKQITTTDLVLYKSLEWRLSAFFRSIGQKQHGEKLVMDWGKVVDASGYAEFKYRDGSDKYFDVTFLDMPAEKAPLGIEIKLEGNDLPF